MREKAGSPVAGRKVLKKFIFGCSDFRDYSSPLQASLFGPEAGINLQICDHKPRFFFPLSDSVLPEKLLRNIYVHALHHPRRRDRANAAKQTVPVANPVQQGNAARKRSRGQSRADSCWDQESLPCAPLTCFPMEYTAPSSKLITVNTPPMMAHTLVTNSYQRCPP